MNPLSNIAFNADDLKTAKLNPIALNLPLGTKMKATGDWTRTVKGHLYVNFQSWPALQLLHLWRDNQFTLAWFHTRNTSTASNSSWFLQTRRLKNIVGETIKENQVESITVTLHRQSTMTLMTCLAKVFGEQLNDSMIQLVSDVFGWIQHQSWNERESIPRTTINADDGNLNLASPDEEESESVKAAIGTTKDANLLLNADAFWNWNLKKFKRRDKNKQQVWKKLMWIMMMWIHWFLIQSILAWIQKRSRRTASDQGNYERQLFSFL